MFIEILVSNETIQQRHLTGVFYMFSLCAEGKGAPVTFAPAKSCWKNSFYISHVWFFLLRMETSCNTSMTHYWLVWKILVFLPYSFFIFYFYSIFSCVCFHCFKICFMPSIHRFSPKCIELPDVQQEPCMNLLDFYMTNCN